MRDLEQDLIQLNSGQKRRDLSDGYLLENRYPTRKEYENRAHDFAYGITFIESSIAKEWLERAIKAEKKIDHAACSSMVESERKSIII